MPLWSGVIIHIERLSNNPSENWIGQVKNKLIKRKRAATSEIITPIYKRILTKFIKNYFLSRAAKRIQHWSSKNNIKRRVKQENNWFGCEWKEIRVNY